MSSISSISSGSGLSQFLQSLSSSTTTATSPIASTDATTSVNALTSDQASPTAVAGHHHHGGGGKGGGGSSFPEFNPPLQRPPERGKAALPPIPIRSLKMQSPAYFRRVTRKALRRLMARRLMRVPPQLRRAPPGRPVPPIKIFYRLSRRMASMPSNFIRTF